MKFFHRKIDTQSHQVAEMKSGIHYAPGPCSFPNETLHDYDIYRKPIFPPSINTHGIAIIR